MNYYGNNDWRDYKYLKHYGVKGMKWGKRKNKTKSSNNKNFINENFINEKFINENFITEEKTVEDYIKEDIIRPAKDKVGQFFYENFIKGEKKYETYRKIDSVIKTFKCFKKKVQKLTKPIVDKVTSFVNKFLKKKIKVKKRR